MGSSPCWAAQTNLEGRRDHKDLVPPVESGIPAGQDGYLLPSQVSRVCRESLTVR